MNTRRFLLKDMLPLHAEIINLINLCTIQKLQV